MRSLIMLSALALPTGSSLAFWQAPRKSKSPPVNCKLLILPGFGNDSMDYMIPNSLVDSLKKRGWQEDQICVLPVERLDWLKVFLRGALDLDFWRSNAPPTKPAFSWYLERIAAEIKEVKHDERIILLGHSAGGWLGRAALGFGSNDKEALSFVDINKVHLDLPQLPPILEPNSPTQSTSIVATIATKLQPDWLRRWWNYYREYISIPDDGETSIVHQPGEFKLTPIPPTPSRTSPKQQPQLEQTTSIYFNRKSTQNLEYHPDWIDAEAEEMGYSQSLIARLFAWLDRQIFRLENWIIDIVSRIFDRG